MLTDREPFAFDEDDEGVLSALSGTNRTVTLSEFKMKYNKLKKPRCPHEDKDQNDEEGSVHICKIVGCQNEVAADDDNGDDLDSSFLGSSDRVGTDSDPYDISNETSFSDFYNFKEDEDPLQLNKELVVSEKKETKSQKSALDVLEKESVKKSEVELRSPTPLKRMNSIEEAQ